MLYPVKLVKQKDAGNYAVYFPDIPEALTCGDDEKDALKQALDALETALDFYFGSDRIIPSPSSPKKGQKTVELPPTVAAAVLLHNEVLRQNIRPADLAKRMGLSIRDLKQLLIFRHGAELDTAARIFTALGKRLELHVA